MHLQQISIAIPALGTEHIPLRMTHPQNGLYHAVEQSARDLAAQAREAMGLNHERRCCYAQYHG